MVMFIVWGRLKFWPGCIPADADAQKISSRRIKFWPGCTADDCLKFLATGDQTCLTFTTLSSLLFKVWWQLNIQDNIFVVQNLDEAEKSPLEVTNFHVSYFDNFLVRGRLVDCDKLLYLSDLFDGRISSPWLCSQFLPDLPLEAESSRVSKC